MNCNTTHYRANSSSVPGDPTEEVAEVFPELAVLNKDGQPETVKYQDLAPLLLNEVQKQHKRALEQEQKASEQDRTIAAQEKALAEEGNAMAEQKKRVGELEARLARLEQSLPAVTEKTR